MCSPLTLSVMSITRLEPPASTLQLLNTINPLSNNFKFITTSSRGIQFALCDGLKTKKQIANRKAHIAQLLEQLTLKHEVGSLNLSWCIIFFQKLYFFHTRFLNFSFLNTVTWHSKHASKRDFSEIKCTSSGNSNTLIANGYLLLFVLYSALKALHGVEGRKGTAVISCQNHVEKLDSIPNFFFFFLYSDSTCFGLLL